LATRPLLRNVRHRAAISVGGGTNTQSKQIRVLQCKS